MKDMSRDEPDGMRVGKRAAEDVVEVDEAADAGKEGIGHRQVAEEADADANAGSDYDAMPDSDVPLEDALPPPRFSIANSLFPPARILVNPRCVTTYAGVSHTQLALDLFGGPEREAKVNEGVRKYQLEDWEGAPESFVCQEQRYV